MYIQVESGLPQGTIRPYDVIGLHHYSVSIVLPSPANARYPLYNWVSCSNVSEVFLLKETQPLVLPHIP